VLKAEVGDQFVRAGPTVGRGEIVGVVTQVNGVDGGPPFIVRWYDDGHASKCNPDEQRYWIRPQVDVHEVGLTMKRDRSMA
jgi:hypothetical protein